MFLLLAFADLPLRILLRMLRVLRLRWSAVAVCFALLAPAAPGIARGSTGWVVRGAGFGHGVGMGQEGAYGYARHGFGYRRILRSYYLHTKIGRAGSSPVRVLLAAGGGPISFSGARHACGRALGETATYRAVRSGSSIVLESAAGVPIASCGQRLRATGGATVGIHGYGIYRGALEARPSSYGGLNVIDAVGLEGYARGVVANEMISSWPAAALRAQAVAVRSYALAGRVAGRGFSLYDDTRSQVYTGIAGETRRTDRAVAATAHQVVTYHGTVALAVYHASSGGHTEHDEVAWPGSTPLPYLRGVPDPYDAVSPYHRWRKGFSAASMQTKLGSLVRGRLKRIVVLRRGSSPRIVRARLVGTAGRTVVSGDTLATRLGLGSTWARFCHGSCPSGGGADSGGVGGVGSGGAATGGVGPDQGSG